MTKYDWILTETEKSEPEGDKMNDNELKPNKVYQIRTLENIKDDDKIKVEKGKLITAKWETMFFTDDYKNKYFLGQVEVLRCL